MPSTWASYRSSAGLSKIWTLAPAMNLSTAGDPRFIPGAGSRPPRQRVDGVVHGHEELKGKRGVGVDDRDPDRSCVEDTARGERRGRSSALLFGKRLAQQATAG